MTPTFIPLPHVHTSLPSSYLSPVFVSNLCPGTSCSHLTPFGSQIGLSNLLCLHQALSLNPLPCSPPHCPHLWAALTKSPGVIPFPSLPIPHIYPSANSLDSTFIAFLEPQPSYHPHHDHPAFMGAGRSPSSSLCILSLTHLFKPFRTFPLPQKSQNPDSREA